MFIDSTITYKATAIKRHCGTSPSKISDLGDLGWGLIVCVANKFPSDAGTRCHILRTSDSRNSQTFKCSESHSLIIFLKLLFLCLKSAFINMNVFSKWLNATFIKIKTEAHNLRLKYKAVTKNSVYIQIQQVAHSPQCIPHQSKPCHFSLNKVFRFQCVPLLKRKQYGEINNYILCLNAKKFTSKFLSLNQNIKLTQEIVREY